MSKLEFGVWKEADVTPEERVFSRAVSYTANDNPKTLLYGRHEKVLQKVEDALKPLSFREEIEEERNKLKRTVHLQFGKDGKIARTTLELAGVATADSNRAYSMKFTRDYVDGMFNVESTYGTEHGRLSITHNLETGQLERAAFVPKHEDPNNPGLQYDFAYNGQSVTPTVMRKGEYEDFDDVPHGEYFDEGEYSFNFSRAAGQSVILGVYDKVSKLPNFQMFQGRIPSKDMWGSIQKTDTWKWIGVIALLRPRTPKMDTSLVNLSKAIIDKYAKDQ